MMIKRFYKRLGFTLRGIVIRLAGVYARLPYIVSKTFDARTRVEWEIRRQEDLADYCYKQACKLQESSRRPLRLYANTLAATGDIHRDNVFMLRQLQKELSDPDTALRGLRQYRNLRYTRKELLLL